MCSPSLATLFSISLFNQLISSFSHFSLDFVDQPSMLFHSPSSSEPAQQNSNSGHFNHLPSPLLPSWCKITETKGSEQNFLNAGCTLEWLTELLKLLCPKQLNQHLLSWKPGISIFKVPQVMLLEGRVENLTGLAGSSPSVFLPSVLVPFSFWSWISPLTSLK